MKVLIKNACIYTSMVLSLTTNIYSTQNPHKISEESNPVLTQNEVSEQQQVQRLERTTLQSQTFHAPANTLLSDSNLDQLTLLQEQVNQLQRQLTNAKQRSFNKKMKDKRKYNEMKTPLENMIEQERGLFKRETKKIMKLKRKIQRVNKSLRQKEARRQERKDRMGTKKQLFFLHRDLELSLFNLKDKAHIEQTRLATRLQQQQDETMREQNKVTELENQIANLQQQMAEERQAAQDILNDIPKQITQEYQSLADEHGLQLSIEEIIQSHEEFIPREVVCLEKFCNICKDEYTDEAEVVVYPCGHSNHKKCADQLLQTAYHAPGNLLSARCTICQNDLPLDLHLKVNSYRNVKPRSEWERAQFEERRSRFVPKCPNVKLISLESGVLTFRFRSQPRQLLTMTPDDVYNVLHGIGNEYRFHENDLKTIRSYYEMRERRRERSRS